MKYSDRHRGFVLVPLFCAMLLSGCIKVGPDFLRPKTAVSPKWLEAGDQRLKAGPADYRAWWKEFNDPALDLIIDRAYGANLSLRAAGVRVLEARAQLGIAVGGLYPQTQQLTGSLTFNRTSEVSPSAVAFVSGGQQQHSFWQDQGNFNISWEMDFWGKFRRAVEAADAGLLAAVADYDSTLVGLTADAASTYVRIAHSKRGSLLPGKMRKRKPRACFSPRRGSRAGSPRARRRTGENGPL